MNRIDELASHIFYDRDWQITSFHPQLLDGLSESFSEQTGIDEEYVTNRLPKVTTEQTVMALSAIKSWKHYGYNWLAQPCKSCMPDLEQPLQLLHLILNVRTRSPKINP